MSENKQSRIKELINRGREQGYLTYDEVNDHLPEDISDPDQVEDIIQMINDMGIRVYETAPDADELLMNDGENTDEIAAAEAAAALAAVETEVGRTTDPVRMYMREMGTVELLSREGEIAIAKRIEEGLRELMHALAFWPRSVKTLLDEFELCEKGERRLTDVISGWLDLAEDPVVPEVEGFQEKPIEAKDAKSEVSDDDEEETASDDDDDADTGIDPAYARERFTELKDAFVAAEETMRAKGRMSKESQQALEEMGSVFRFFKLPPRQFDPI